MKLYLTVIKFFEPIIGFLFPLNKHSGSLLVILGALSLSFGGIIVKSFEGANLWQILFWRQFFFTLTVTIYLLFKYKKNFFKIFHKSGIPGLIAGIFLGIDHAAWHHGIMLTTIANSTLFASMAPVFVVIYSYLLFSIIVSKKFLLGLIASIIGAILLMYSSLELSIKNIYGDFWSLMAGAFYAAYLMSTGILRDKKLNLYVIFFFGTLFSALTLLVIVIFSL